MKNKKIIVANWKMNPRTAREATALFQKIKREAEALARVETVVCPPFVFLDTLSKKAARRCALGAQDVFWEAHGAYTGEVSPAQLRGLDVSYVILGHSERRALGETSEIIQKKLKLALAYRLNVILCVGESDRDSRGRYLSFLKEEIKKSIGKIKTNDLHRLIIAYEPIWAVGVKVKKADTPAALFEVVIFIRKVLSDLFNSSAAFRIPVLYGGSVSSLNARGFLVEGGASGLLVGRASLEPNEFNAILEIAQVS